MGKGLVGGTRGQAQACEYAGDMIGGGGDVGDPHFASTTADRAEQEFDGKHPTEQPGLRITSGLRCTGVLGKFEQRELGLGPWRVRAGGGKGAPGRGT